MTLAVAIPTTILFQFALPSRLCNRADRQCRYHEGYPLTGGPSCAFAPSRCFRLPSYPRSRKPSCSAFPISTRQGRLHLRRRPVDRARRRRDGHPPDRPPGPRGLRQVLARRQVDRLHRPVRRRRAGLRHPGDRRRAQAAHLLSRARAAPAALGLRQPGLRLDERRQARHLPLPARRLVPRPTAASTPCRSTAGLAEPLPMPESGAGVVLARRQQDRLLAARPRLPHREALPRRAGQPALHLRPRDLRGEEDHRQARAPSRDPMWIGDTIYFDSDRDGHFNLYSYDPTSGKTTPAHLEQRSGTSAGPARTATSRIVYELNGELEDPRREDRQEHADLDHRPRRRRSARRPSRVSAAHLIEDAALSPKGERVLFVRARRHLHRAGREGRHPQPDPLLGRARQVARWSPDGSQDRVHLRPDRRGGDLDRSPRTASKPRAAHHRRQGHAAIAPSGRPTASASPSATRTAGSVVLTLADKQAHRDRALDAAAQIRDYAWSPRGNHLAFSMNDPNGFASIYIWSAADGKLRRVTSEHFDSSTPGVGPRRQLPVLPQRSRFRAADLDGSSSTYADQPAGRHLRPGPAQGREEPVPARERRGQRPRRTTPRRTTRRRTSKKRRQEGRAEGPRSIDFDGIAGRVVAVPVEANNYGAPRGEERAPALLGRRRRSTTDAQADTKPSLRIYSHQGPQRDDAGRGRRRLRPVAGRLEGPGAPGPAVQPRWTRRPRARPARRPSPPRASCVDRVPAAGVGADLRRGLAPLPRLLLRAEHARLRLGGAARAVQAAARVRGASLAT